MHFKKLELYGFKSFANKTTFHFEPGVTAIVGPNGCGKSNLAEAIKWVLGEDNARELRGMRMEDVIFNGTDKKEPINFAEVSLTLSNDGKILPVEFDEVTIGRRVFRSGESEYFLNKTQVRLKDIVELFMGTGIGSDTYSMIGQGKVELLISSKPEDRRAIFEEASGITKYKSKKKEALRKLEQTEHNLVRVDDIIHEVKRQINSIERQAQKARRYQENFEKLKNMDLTESSIEYQGLVEERTALSNENESFKTTEADLACKVGESQAKLEAERANLAEIDQRISSARHRGVDITGGIKKNQDRISLDEERIEELEARIINLNEEIASLDKKCVGLRERLNTYSAELNVVAQARADKQMLLEERQRFLDETEALIKETQENISKAKLEVVDVAARQTRAKNDLTRLQANIQNLRARHRRLGLEKEKVEEELSSVGARFDSISSEVEAIVSRVNELQNERQGLSSAAELKEGALRVKENRLRILQEDLTTTQSKLEFLEDLIRKREGFESGVKAILLEKEKPLSGLEGVFGSLADLIEVTPGYEAAVEAALGEDVQSLVVDSTHTAQKAIQYLRDQNAGRARFILLDRVCGLGDKQELPQDPLILGKLIDFVKIDDQFRPALSYLLKGVLLVEDMDRAFQILEGDASIRKVVAKDGSWARSGAVSGGVNLSHDETSLIGRQAKLAGLKMKVDKCKQEILSTKEAKGIDQAELEELKSRIENNAAILREEEKRQANKEAEKSSIELEKGKLEEELSVVALELEETAQEEEELTVRCDELKQKIVELEEADSRLQNEIGSGQELVASKSKQKETLLVELAQVKTELASLEEKERTQNETHRAMHESVNSEEQALAARRNALQESQRRIEVLKVEIAELGAQNGCLDEELKQAREEEGSITAHRFELTNIVAGAEGEIKEKQAGLEEIRDTIRNLEVKDAELSYKQRSLADRIFEAYKIDLPTFELPQQEGPIDRENLRNEIQQLRDKLDSMGPVNLVAIEEHEELKNRYAFLTSQHEDLINAKESLVKAIAKINKTTRELFMDNFQKVQVTFREYFRMLFGGGNCELLLLDERDVLESGIEIIVRPPGKKAQSISLLSGGEKALTAIALLFAIFKVKPSPFCVLDEIDAALDEANVDRFARVLQEFIKQSQFIIITHNKKTIAMADVMYGITMEESGISKIVSARFTEAQRPKEVAAQTA